MKKLSVFVLTALLAVSLFAVFANAEEQNVALGKSYTYTGAYTDPNSGNVLYPDTDNKELTDGIAASKDADVAYGVDLWVGMNQGGAGVVPNSGTVEIVVDLGSSVSGITKFTLNTLHLAGPAIKRPSEVTISVSTDNQNFSNVGKMTSNQVVSKPGADDNSKEDGIYEFTLSSTEKTARYVKYTIKLGGAWCFVSEVGVYTGAPAASKDPIGETSSEEATSSQAQSQAASAAESSKPQATSSAASSTASTTSAAESAESSGLSTGAIIGIVIGAVVVIGIVVAVIVVNKKKNQ